MSIPILFQPLELFFVDDIDLAKGKEAGSSGNQALWASRAGICLFPSLYYNIPAHPRRAYALLKSTSRPPSAAAGG